MEEEKLTGSHLLKIGDVSKLCGIPVPTLRHWEKEGLLPSVRDKDNKYRYFRLQTVVQNLCDIVFYRQIDVPFFELKTILDQSPKELNDLLDRTRISLERQASRLTSKINLIKERQAIIDEITNNYGKIIERDIPFDSIIEFDYINQEHYKMYYSEPNSFVGVNNINGDILDDINGLVAGGDCGKVIFTKNKEDKYLMSYVSNNPLVPTYNFDGVRERIAYMGYSISMYVTQFLINMLDKNGQNCDFYRIWFKVK